MCQKVLPAGAPGNTPLKHPLPNVPPFHRLMGGSKPGNDLTNEEKAIARKTATDLFAEPRQH